MKKLTQERLKDLLDYNHETGIFTCKVDTGNKFKKGDIAGYFHVSTGYWHIYVESKTYKAHRLAFLWMDGYFPENDIDHMDRNKINNKWSNLREVSKTCNNRNCSMRSDNISGIKGVWKNKKNKWIVEIYTPKKIYIGGFDNLLDAAKARWEAEIKYNFPSCNTTSSAYVYLKENKAI